MKIPYSSIIGSLMYAMVCTCRTFLKWLMLLVVSFLIFKKSIAKL